MAKASENKLCISVPIVGYGVDAQNNILSIVNTNHELIAKALGVKKLPVRIGKENIDFPWFSEGLTDDEKGICERFIGRICTMARTQKRVQAKNKMVKNEKYAFRCFLLRLGYIGDDSKADRKYLLRNLDGNSAFKGGNTDEQ